MTTKEEWFFIVNPRAGSGKTMSEWVPAERKLERLGIPYVTAMTDHKRHAISLAYEAAENGYRRIVAVGGDGSLHEIFGGICRFCDNTQTPTEEFTLGVIPIGSGNDWIKSLDIPHDTLKVVDLIASGKRATMDVVRVLCSGGKISYMANIGGTGFDSHVCKRVNIQKESGMRGKRIYLNALVHTIKQLQAINVKVMADDAEVFSGRCYSIALGNGRYSGSGMRQVPLADMDDGALDMFIVPKLPLRDIVPEMPRLFKGNLNESTAGKTVRFKKLEIAPLDEKSADIVELDGEIVGKLPLYINMDGRKIGVIHG